MIQLPEEVIEQLKSYVYVYIDPRNNKAFYIGKGKGNRLFSHLLDTSESNKVKRIQEIIAEGFEPEINIVRFGLDDSEASLVEAALIDFYGLENLTNIKSGFHRGTFGLMSSNDIIGIFEAKPVEVEEKAILFTINSLYRSGMSDEELYETTRGIWKLGKNREKAEYAFCVTHGIVREVYKIEKWYPAGTLEYKVRPDSDSFSKTNRWEFEGSIANDIRDKYIGKSVGKGSQNPIRYKNLSSQTTDNNPVQNIHRNQSEHNVIERTQKAILITINKLYRENMSELELYEATRGIWRVGEKRNEADYAFAIYRGKVLEVYKINQWFPAGTLEYKTRPDSTKFKNSGRWEFEGTIAENEIRNQYIGCNVGLGGQNPVRYKNL